MLRRRVLTAAVLIPPLIAALFLLPSFGIAFLLGIFVFLAAWEWAGLAELHTPWKRIVYATALMVAGAAALVGTTQSAGALTFVFGATILWWSWAFAELLVGDRVRRGIFVSRAGRIGSGFVVLVPPWIGMYALHAQDVHRPAALLFVLVLVWVADSAAYFVGHRFGRTKLAPTVSPGKTVEGFAGGMAAVVLVGVSYGTMVWRLESAELVLWVLLTLLTGLFSVLGDLTESRYKRVAGVKDSGHLLPGHGGVLDRIDALAAAVPAFTLGWLLLKPS